MSDYLTAKETVEDDDGAPEYMAWITGTGVNSALRSAVNDPGSDRRSVERQRMTLTGTPTYRSYSALPSGTALLADWMSVVMAMQSDIKVTVDKVSRPGDVILTSRLPVSSPKLTRPGRVYKIEPA